VKASSSDFRVREVNAAPRRLRVTVGLANRLDDRSGVAGAVANVLATISDPMTTLKTAVGRQSGIFKQPIGRVTASPALEGEGQASSRAAGANSVIRRMPFARLNRDRAWHLGHSAA